MNTTDNELRTYKQGTNSSAYGNFSYLNCDTRDIILYWQKTLIIYHFPVVWESATKCGPHMYISPFPNLFQALKSVGLNQGPDHERYLNILSKP